MTTTAPTEMTVEEFNALAWPIVRDRIVDLEDYDRSVLEDLVIGDDRQVQDVVNPEYLDVTGPIWMPRPGGSVEDAGAPSVDFLMEHVIVLSRAVLQLQMRLDRIAEGGS
jgi:hypothetical protein